VGVLTEAQRHQLFTQLVGAIGPEGAATMLEIVNPLTNGDLATKADITRLELDITRVEREIRADITRLEHATRTDITRLEHATKADLAELKASLSRTVAGWLFLSQAVLVAIVSLLVTLR
jgi:hypothetical protein